MQFSVHEVFHLDRKEWGEIEMFRGEGLWRRLMGWGLWWESVSLPLENFF